MSMLSDNSHFSSSNASQEKKTKTALPYTMQDTTNNTSCENKQITNKRANKQEQTSKQASKQEFG